MNTKPPVTLLNIPDDRYSEYRYDVIFNAYKWDPQVKDSNTVSRHCLLITTEVAHELNMLAERLSAEVTDMEEVLIDRIGLYKELGFSGRIKKSLSNMGHYDRNKNVRLMRFDFHPTEDGWKISEVNSDVPGGLAEASVLPQIVRKFFKNAITGENVAEHILISFRSILGKRGRIAFVHATSYADDRQVMQFTSDYFQQDGWGTLFAAPDHIRWADKKPISIIDGKEGVIDGIVRFFPLEWLDSLPRTSDWQGYFDCKVPCCNHPATILTQSKRLPLVWDKLGVEIPYWRRLLPETMEPHAVPKGSDDWIYKPAFGRVGGGISIKGAISEQERTKIEKEARQQKRLWIAQRMFTSVPAESFTGQLFHVSIGVFTVDGRASGFYARLSESARIDENAQDVPVLIETRQL